MEVNPFKKNLTKKTLVENIENNPDINQEPRGQKQSLEEEENIRPNKRPALEVKVTNEEVRTSQKESLEEGGS